MPEPFTAHKEFLEKRGIAHAQFNHPRPGVVLETLKLVPEEVWKHVEEVRNVGSEGGMTTPGGKGMVVGINPISPTTAVEHDPYFIMHEFGHVAEEALQKQGVLPKELVNEADIKVRNAHLFADFFALYVLDGKNLRSHVSRLPADRKKAFAMLHEAFRKRVFQGKTFSGEFPGLTEAVRMQKKREIASIVTDKRLDPKFALERRVKLEHPGASPSASLYEAMRFIDPDYAKRLAEALEKAGVKA
jgi:hypothetical protein